MCQFQLFFLREKTGTQVIERGFDGLNGMTRRARMPRSAGIMNRCAILKTPEAQKVTIREADHLFLSVRSV